MNTRLIRGLGIALLVSATGLSALWAQSFSIKGGRIGVDGLVSTGGVFSASGIMGQTDAGQAAGGGFTITGGIVAAVQTPGAPYLSVTNLGSQIVVSWLAPADGWSLERTNILTGGTGSWTPIPPPYQTNGGVISVSCTNAPPAGNWFFRLHK